MTETKRFVKVTSKLYEWMQDAWKNSDQHDRYEIVKVFDDAIRHLKEKEDKNKFKYCTCNKPTISNTGICVVCNGE